MTIKTKNLSRKMPRTWSRSGARPFASTLLATKHSGAAGCRRSSAIAGRDVRHGNGFQAGRSPAGVYRTAPLAGLLSHQKGGFYHDGRFATLSDVVNHYDACLNLQLTEGEKADLVQYLLTL